MTASSTPTHARTGSLDESLLPARAKYQLLQIEWALLTIALISAVALLIASLWMAIRGFDVTDESFYLNWISNPSLYENSVSQFGFVYHPLYELVNGNIVRLRQANLLITTGFAFILFRALLWRLFTEGRNAGKGEGGFRLPSLAHNIAALAAAPTVLVAFRNWLVTPGYNSLTLQGLLLAATGVALLVPSRTWRGARTAGLLLGVGGCITFLAKPSSAAALAASVVIYLGVSRNWNWRALTLAGASSAALLVTSALFIDRSLARFADRIGGGLDDIKLMNGGHSVSAALRWDDLTASAVLIKHSAFIAACATVVLLVSLAPWRSFRVGMVVAAGAMTTVATLFSFAIVRHGRETSQFVGVWELIPVTVAVFVVVATQRRGLVSRRTVNVLPLFAWFVAAPYVYVIGTNNNYWNSAPNSGVFWICAAVVALATLPPLRRPVIPIVSVLLIAHVITASLLQMGFERPYRQTTPLRLMDREITLRPGDYETTLKVSAATYGYLVPIRRAARSADFAVGTPMLDMSGHSPGVLYALGASAVGQAWMIGGYPGSDRRSQAALSRVSCNDLATAWILLEPGGERALSNDILNSSGISDLSPQSAGIRKVSSNYETIVRVPHANSGGQYLLRPTRSKADAINACTIARRAAQT